MIATTVDESGTRRVVTKLVEGERLVSCTCCTPVNITCCLLDTEPDLVVYPNGAISQDKLPPTIVLDGVTYSVGTLGYGDTTNGVFLESGVWAVYKSGVRTTRRCLISNIATDLEDEFPDTVTVSYSNFGLTVTTSLTRLSLCYYEGTFTFDGTDYDVLLYQNGGGSLLQEGNVWTLSGPIIGVADFGSGLEAFLQGSNYSTSTNNQPVGSYTGEFGEPTDGSGLPLITLTATITTP
jgi:hypothetical protein